MARPQVYVTRMIPEAGIDLLRQTCDVEVNLEDRPLTRAELLENVRGREGRLAGRSCRNCLEYPDPVAPSKGGCVR